MSLTGIVDDGVDNGPGLPVYSDVRRGGRIEDLEIRSQANLLADASYEGFQGQARYRLAERRLGGPALADAKAAPRHAAGRHGAFADQLSVEGDKAETADARPGAVIVDRADDLIGPRAAPLHRTGDNCAVKPAQSADGDARAFLEPRGAFEPVQNDGLPVPALSMS
jgi:hypothetical protein